MNEKIFLDMLCTNGVSVVTQKTVTDSDGKVYLVGGEQRTAYENSESGRERLKKDIPDPYLTAILEIWGDSPTVILPNFEDEKEVKKNE